MRSLTALLCAIATARAVPVTGSRQFETDGIKMSSRNLEIAFGDERVSVAGDRGNTRETKGIINIGVAFLPVNLPYTTTPEMAVDATRAVKLDIVYPCHTGDTNLHDLIELLTGEQDVGVRIRYMLDGPKKPAEVYV